MRKRAIARVETERRAVETKKGGQKRNSLHSVSTTHLYKRSIDTLLFTHTPMQQPFLARMSQASFVTSVHELCEGRMRTDEVFAVHWKLAQGGSAVSFASIARHADERSVVSTSGANWRLQARRARKSSNSQWRRAWRSGGGLGG